MNGPGRAGHRGLFFLLAPLLLASIALPAARSEAAEGGDASASQVAEGLKLIQDIAADAATAAQRDKDKATQIAGGIEAVWSKIEDVVRGNDKDAYITFEDSFESLGAAAKTGDAKKAAKASDAIAAAVKAYVAKHPAPAAASAGSAAPPAAARAAEAATPAPSTAASPAPAASAAPAPAAPSSAGAASSADPTLARTGPGRASTLTALAGAALGLGGLAVLLGARRRRPSPLA